MKIKFYRHWFIDKHGTPICTEWQYMNWDVFSAQYKSIKTHIKTDERIFEPSN